MTEVIKNELYAALVAEVEAYEKEGRRLNRYGVILIMVGWFGQIDANHIDLVDKLYAAALVSA